MDRRSLLLGLGAAGAVRVAPAAATPVPDQAPNQAPVTAAAPAAAPAVGRADVQAGVVTPQQPTALLVAFDVLAQDRVDLARLLRVLTERIALLTRGGRAPDADPLLPPPDSGLLGPIITVPDLTITVSVGASLFDDRFDLAPRRPRHLTTMPRFANDAPNPSQTHGDLLLQICSGLPEANIHALRDVIRHTPDLLAPRWKIEGFRRTVTLGETPRNMLGFKDGSANPNSADGALMDQLVWVGAEHGEPAWATGGSYQVVRVIQTLVEHWDRTPLHEQQTIIGRSKMSGAPLGKAGEFDDPGYASDPKGDRIPVDAHIRLANPRTPQAMQTRILRRGYNFSRGLTPAGQLDMGLLFICYQADLSTGFVAVQERLNGEPLEEYVKPVGGGYFFVLPAAAPGHVLGEDLLSA